MMNVQSISRRARLLSAAPAIALALILPTSVPTDAHGRLGPRIVVTSASSEFMVGSPTGLMSESKLNLIPAERPLSPAKPAAIPTWEPNPSPWRFP
jgi:hypothetical protein